MLEKDKFFNISLFEIEILDKILISFSFLKINAIMESFKIIFICYFFKIIFSINSNFFLSNSNLPNPLLGKI